RCQSASGVFGQPEEALRTPEESVLAMIPYIEDQQMRFNTPVHTMTRHTIGLFNGLRGAKLWRQRLSDAPQMKEPAFILPLLEQIQAMQLEPVAA
ncbi:MAG: hypothetical protein DI586_08890, partial [Micavibrio aeruginosavorus]